MAERQANFPVIGPKTEGEQTNPTDSLLMADTGAISEKVGGGGIYEVLITFACSAAADFMVQRRNVANSASIGDEPVVKVAAGNTISIPYRFEIERNERVRVIMDDALTGTAAVSITAQRVA